MTEPSLYDQILDFANRADPWPLYEKLRSQPVWQEADGTFVVSTFREIYALQHDPRLSSDLTNLLPEFAAKLPPAQGPGGAPPSFLVSDPPRHDTLRRVAMRQFGPPHRPDLIDKMAPALKAIVTGLIDNLADKQGADLVDDVAYPFPVAVICHLLGVPPEDEPRFSAWVDPIVNALARPTPEQLQARTDARQHMSNYLFELAQRRRAEPGEDMISGYLTDDGPDGRLEGGDLFSTLMLLLVAGHETTVNLITNGWLTLQRHPEVLQRLRTEPGFSIRLVEELLRYEPSVHILPFRTAVADIAIGDTTIRKGHPIAVMLASGNRDPEQFPHPDRFDPDRTDTVHLSFATGIHYCLGAPLARLEAQFALTQLAKRLRNPRVLADPPPYRPSPVLRGPIHLPIAFDEVCPA
ncbi:cytochrome P450 [Amorphoplanes digitatis]|uniref:Cytochrome P450 n=1 Tax=Actinoplanes digitatis TaxID=1868 RepID=A0A7W7MPC6_9ACTN|nr:cytochrome P450 [Actinoplanes digitatis]MBB4762008.1 cytochrome P450 [Actinoplanes digitatis]GID91121.1 putative cytochrome P450 [Actinoplanes digitatis]